MRDLKLSEFAEELRHKLSETGVNLPKALVYQMTKAFFKQAEKTAEEGKERFFIHHRALTQVYQNWDVKKLCGELAEGKDVLTADRLIQLNKMQKGARRYYRKMSDTADVKL